MNQNPQNRIEIDQIVHQFFDLFTNVNDSLPQVNRIKDLFIKEGLLINNTAAEPAIYTLDTFIKPREEILTNGTLTDFREQEITSHTVILDNIAQRSCQYEKSGKLNGEAFEGKGNKLMQFIKIKNKWMLSSVLWSDEK